jgi:hypothetical protein
MPDLRIVRDDWQDRVRMMTPRNSVRASAIGIAFVKRGVKRGCAVLSTTDPANHVGRDKK